MLRRFSAPLSVFLSVTNACNLRCTYCSADSGVPAESDLSLNEILQLIDDLISLKVFSVTITGGEPFIRKDIFQILEKLTSSNMSVSLISNGILIRDAVAAQLVDLGIENINISLDGGTPETNDLTRGRNAFERTFKGIQTLVRHGIRPMILVTVTKHNHEQVAGISALLADTGVDSVAFNLMAPVGRGCSSQSLQVKGEELDSFAQLVAEARKEHGAFIHEDISHWYNLPFRLEKRRSNSGENSSGKHKVPMMLPCGAAKTACAISSDGSVFPCNKFSGFSCGNIRTNSLRDIWSGERMERIRILGETPITQAKGCSTCSYNEVCAGGCRADAFLEFNDLEAPDPHCAVLADAGIHDYMDRSDTSRVVGKSDLVQIGCNSAAYAS